MKNKLKDLWLTLVEKVSDNKETVIRVGGVVAGIVVGAVVTAIVANAQESDELEELRLLAEEDDVDELEVTE